MELALTALVALCAGMAWFILYLQRDAANARAMVRELMELVDSIYRKSLDVPTVEPVTEPSPDPMLPTELAEFVAGFEEPEDREEMGSYMMARIQAGHDAEVIAQEFEI